MASPASAVVEDAGGSRDTRGSRIFYRFNYETDAAIRWIGDASSSNSPSMMSSTVGISAGQARALIARKENMEQDRTFNLQLGQQIGAVAGGGGGDGGPTTWFRDDSMIIPFGSVLIVQRLARRHQSALEHDAQDRLSSWNVVNEMTGRTETGDGDTKVGGAIGATKSEHHGDSVPDRFLCLVCKGILNSPLMVRCNANKCKGDVCRQCAQVKLMVTATDVKVEDEMSSRGQRLLPSYRCPTCERPGVLFVPNRALAINLSEWQKASSSHVKTESTTQNVIDEATSQVVGSPTIISGGTAGGAVGDMVTSSQIAVLGPSKHIRFLHTHSALMCNTASELYRSSVTIFKDPSIRSQTNSPIILYPLAMGGGGTTVVTPGICRVSQVVPLSCLADVEVTLTESTDVTDETMQSFKALSDAYFEVFKDEKAGSSRLALIMVSWDVRYGSLAFLPARAQQFANVLSQFAGARGVKRKLTTPVTAESSTASSAQNFQSEILSVNDSTALSARLIQEGTFLGGASAASCSAAVSSNVVSGARTGLTTPISLLVQRRSEMKAAVATDSTMPLSATSKQIMEDQQPQYCDSTAVQTLPMMEKGVILKTAATSDTDVLTPPSLLREKEEDDGDSTRMVTGQINVKLARSESSHEGCRVVTVIAAKAAEEIPSKGDNQIADTTIESDEMVTVEAVGNETETIEDECFNGAGLIWDPMMKCWMSLDEATVSSYLEDENRTDGDIMRGTTTETGGLLSGSSSHSSNDSSLRHPRTALVPPGCCFGEMNNIMMSMSSGWKRKSRRLQRIATMLCEQWEAKSPSFRLLQNNTDANHWALKNPLLPYMSLYPKLDETMFDVLSGLQKEALEECVNLELLPIDALPNMRPLIEFPANHQATTATKSWAAVHSSEDLQESSHLSDNTDRKHRYNHQPISEERHTIMSSDRQHRRRPQQQGVVSSVDQPTRSLSVMSSTPPLVHPGAGAANMMFSNGFPRQNNYNGGGGMVDSNLRHPVLLPRVFFSPPTNLMVTAASKGDHQARGGYQASRRGQAGGLEAPATFQVPPSSQAPTAVSGTFILVPQPSDGPSTDQQPQTFALRRYESVSIPSIGTPSSSPCQSGPPAPLLMRNHAGAYLNPDGATTMVVNGLPQHMIQSANGNGLPVMYNHVPVLHVIPSSAALRPIQAAEPTFLQGAPPRGDNNCFLLSSQQLGGRRPRRQGQEEEPLQNLARRLEVIDDEGERRRYQQQLPYQHAHDSTGGESIRSSDSSYESHRPFALGVPYKRRAPITAAGIIESPISFAAAEERRRAHRLRTGGSGSSRSEKLDENYCEDNLSRSSSSGHAAGDSTCRKRRWGGSEPPIKRRVMSGNGGGVTSERILHEEETHNQNDMLLSRGSGSVRGREGERSSFSSMKGGGVEADSRGLHYSPPLDNSRRSSRDGLRMIRATSRVSSNREHVPPQQQRGGRETGESFRVNEDEYEKRRMRARKFGTMPNTEMNETNGDGYYEDDIKADGESASRHDEQIGSNDMTVTPGGGLQRRQVSQRIGDNRPPIQSHFSPANMIPTSSTTAVKTNNGIREGPSTSPLHNSDGSSTVYGRREATSRQMVARGVTGNSSSSCDTRTTTGQRIQAAELPLPTRRWDISAHNEFTELESTTTLYHQKEDGLRQNTIKSPARIVVNRKVVASSTEDQTSSPSAFLPPLRSVSLNMRPSKEGGKDSNSSRGEASPEMRKLLPTGPAPSVRSRVVGAARLFSVSLSSTAANQQYASNTSPTIRTTTTPRFPPESSLARKRESTRSSNNCSQDYPGDSSSSVSSYHHRISSSRLSSSLTAAVDPSLDDNGSSSSRTKDRGSSPSTSPLSCDGASKDRRSCRGVTSVTRATTRNLRNSLFNL